MHMKTQTIAINEECIFQLRSHDTNTAYAYVSVDNLYVWNKFQNITKNITLNRQMILKSLQTSVTLQH